MRGTLYGLDGAQHQVTRTAGGFGLPIPPESSATLSVAPDGKSARVIAAGRDRTVDLGFTTALHGGKIRVLASSKQFRIRASAGHRVRLHIAVHDWAGNTKVLDRYFTLSR